MTNYYEEIMPIIKDEEDYLKYYIDESTPIFDKLNNIIKKGQPIQRQALLKNLIIYEKEDLFKSLMNFIINTIPVWDIETTLCFPKSLYNIVTNVDYILEQDLFNTIFKHMIVALSSGFEKARNEYLFYFNKIIEFFSVIDIKNNNQIKTNFFPYKINEEIIQSIIDLGKFGQTPQNRKLCCYLCSSLCRMCYNNTKENEDVKKLYKRLNYLFWDMEKTTETQMARELLYIIPLFHEELFKSEDIMQAIESYINHDSDHVIQVMVIISLLKNLIYLNKKKEQCNYIFNVLMNKIKEIIEDLDYEPIYKNVILHILINTLYINHKELDTSFLYPVFQLGIIINYYNYYKLDIMFIKNFYKFFSLINYFLDNGQNLELKYNENEKTTTSNNKILIEQINTQIKPEAYFIKIINELFCVEDNNNISDDNKSKENNKQEKNNEKNIDNIKDNKSKEINIDEIIIINNNIQNNNNEKNSFNIDDLLHDELFFDENIDIIFNNKNENEKLEKFIYNKDNIKKILYIYLPKIIECFNNLKSNKNLYEKLLFLFDKRNIELLLNTYSSSLEYILEKSQNIIINNKESKNKNTLKKHPLYELLLHLLKKNFILFKYQGKGMNKNSNSKNEINEGTLYNKLFTSYLSNIISGIHNLKNSIKGKSLVMIGKILKLLIPKIYKYNKNLTYNKNLNFNDIKANINLSFNINKNSQKNFYYERIYDIIFNDLIYKIMNNSQTLGFHIIKEYIEIIPIIILYTREKRKFYNFFIKEIFTSDSFYIRKYTLLFYEQCFAIYSMNYLVKNNFFSDFCILFKDKVNLLSIGAIEILFKYSKKVICYSKEKFLAACQILNEVYDNNTKSLNNKNQEITFDKDKNIIINKIINVSNNINKYFSEQDLNEEKNKENKLLINENNIYKQHCSINNKNINNEENNIINENTIGNNNLISDENTKINVFQSSKLISHTYRYNSLNQNKNVLNILTLSHNQKESKNLRIFDKPLKLFKEKGKNLSNKCNNILKNNSNKENNELLSSINFNNNNTHYNKRYNSISKNIRSLNYNKHILPKLQEQEIKIFEKNGENTNNIINKKKLRSVDFTESQYNLLSDKKIRKNEGKNNVINSKERIPSAKLKMMKYNSFMNKDCSFDNLNLDVNIKSKDEKKNNNTNLNLRYSYNYEFNYGDKNLSNKDFSMTFRPNSKTMKLNKNSFISNRIYIDANK